MTARRYCLVLAALTTLGCSATDPDGPARRFRMGFSVMAPRPTIESVLATIEAWRPHADIAQLTLGVPWKQLLADTSAAFLIRREQAELVALYRSRGLPVMVQVDPTDGLARDKEAPELVAAGRSIAEPSVQALYREYVLAVDSILDPQYLGLAMETNLIRAIAPASVYQALRSMVNATAAALDAQQSSASLFISVQVGTAWGRLPATNQFMGIAQDRADFPFIESLGVSSYPFLEGFTEPEDVPLNYYGRLLEASLPSLPILVAEGGWSSASVPGISSSPDKQARWIDRQVQIADAANVVAITQITFTDLDLSSYQVPAGSILPLFANLGLVDTELDPKPALDRWRRAFARPLR